MANRINFLASILLLIGLALITVTPLRVAAQTSPYDNPPTVDPAQQTNFSIEANDQDVLSDQVYFLISSIDTLADQPIVFFLSVDGSVVRQISLNSLADSRKHWQSAVDTTQIPNGSYHIVAGTLDSQFKVQIWHDAGWKQVYNLTTPRSQTAPKKILTLADPVPVEKLTAVTTTPTTTSEVAAVSVDATTDTTTIPAATPAVTEFCQQAGVTDATQCSVLELAQRYPECQTAGLWQLSDCQNYLSRIYFVQACEPERITDQAQCQEYWRQAVTEHISCQLAKDSCQQSMKDHIGEAAAHWIISQRAQAVLTGLESRLTSYKTLQQGLSARGIPTGSPFIQSFGLSDQPIFKLIPAESAMTIEADGSLVSSWSAVMMIDSDADGLSDDAELRYGTKKDQSDTDGDSYLDGDEVQHGFNPIGNGPMIAPIEAVDSLLYSGRSWQQPLQSGDVDKRLMITSVKPFANGKGIVIFGQAQVLQTVTLFFYGSQIPLVASVRADEQGAWTYYVSQPLVSSRYTLYATQMTKEGLVMGKSDPTIMYIKNGQPVTPAVFAQEQPKVLGIDFISSQSPSLLLMIIGGVILAGGLLFFIGWLVSRRG